MYYFACINEEGICYHVEQWPEYNGELEGNPYYVQIDSYDYDLIFRKKYVNGEWVDTTASEAQNYDGRHMGLNGEWLDVIIDSMKNDIENHTHDNYASQSDLNSLEAVVANKADSSSLTNHINDITSHVTAVNKNNWSSAYEHSQSAHAPVNAQANQNAFSNIAIGNITISSDSETDTLTLVAGNNVTLTPNAENDSIVISATNTDYTHPTSSGNKHIPSGGSSGQILRWSSDGTATWGDDNHEHYAINVTVAGEDLDNYTDAGIFTFAQSYTPANIPEGTNGWLIVIPWKQGNTTVKQIWLRHGSTNVNDSETYVRTKIGTNGWSKWSRYYTTSNPPTCAEVGASPAFTNSSGGVEYSYGSNSGKNVLTEISNMPQGLHTVYSINGTAGNPRKSESFRFLIHKTSETIGWILAWDAQGSIFTNYQSSAGTFKGWKCIYDASPSSMILWSGEAYMQSVNSTPQVITPSKKLSECRTGWMLLWSDYDPNGGANDTDFSTTFIPKFTPSGGTWGGKCFYCDIPMYVGSDTTDLSTEKRCIKPIYVHDNCLKGSYQNTSAGRNDVVLRAVYEV